MENVAQSGSTELKDIIMEIKTKENNTKQNLYVLAYKR